MIAIFQPTGLPITLEVAQNISNILDVIFEPNIKELNRVNAEGALQKLNEHLKVGTGKHWQKVKDVLVFPNGQMPYLAIEVREELYFLCKANDDDKETPLVYMAHKQIAPEDTFLKFGVLWSLQQNKVYLLDIIAHLAKKYSQ